MKTKTIRDRSSRMVAPKRWVVAGAVALVLLGGVSASAEEKAEVPSLAQIHESLVRLVQGGDTLVAASPALCAEQGLIPPRSGPDDPRGDVKQWYFSARGCTLQYPTDVEGVVTRATAGFEKDIFRSPAKAAQLKELLAALAAGLEREKVPAQQRLMLHSMVWEIAHAIDEARAMRSSPELEAAGCQAFATLRATAYTPEEAAALPSTLSRLPAAAEAPEIAELVEKILARDPGVVEILPTTEAHAELLLGRFTPRIFFTTKNEAQREAAVRYLTETPYGSKGQLPLRISGVEAILVLYFNVLSPDFEILPTEQVAFWQQYGFDRQLSVQPDEFEQAEDAVHFLSVRYRRQLSGDEVHYAKLPETAMTRHGFVDAMPPAPAAPVTTLRGACIKCHRRVISSFHPEEEREVEFTLPLKHSGRDLLTPVFERKTEAWLRGRSQQCAAAATPEAPDTATLAPRPSWERD